jgi:pyrroline-5-carboxylate reductase
MKIAIIGCGSMGLTYAKSFLKNKIVSEEDLLLVEKNAEMKERLKSFGKVYSLIPESIKNCEIIILCTKPQDAKEVFSSLKSLLDTNQLVISIMAGITIDRLVNDLSHNAIIRAMPNTPAQLGMGITGYCSSDQAKIQHILKADNLLSCTGKTIYFDNEKLLDAVTALSGSGPAYFYYLIDAFVQSGIEMGIDPATSELLVKQTMLGSFHMMNATEKSTSELIALVASKGGTTEAALNSFDLDNLKTVINRGVKAAEKRSKELSGY